MTARLRWRVQAAPTGPYRSFSSRGWPHLETADGTYVAVLTCDDDYTPARARGEQAHRPIRVLIQDLRPSGEPGKTYRPRQRLRASYGSLAAAKADAEAFFAAHPEWLERG